jgi:hypothetical protein
MTPRRRLETNCSAKLAYKIQLTLIKSSRFRITVESRRPNLCHRSSQVFVKCVLHYVLDTSAPRSVLLLDRLLYDW